MGLNVGMVLTYTGKNYTMETSARSFTHFIPQAQLGIALQQAKFFSILLDGSTDSKTGWSLVKLMIRTV